MSKAWIPNSLTMGNLMLGFISIIISSQQTSSSSLAAGILIICAALLDGCDGQVARALKVQSKLGAELDSLADLVAFGLAPAVLSYNKYLLGLNVNFGSHIFDFGILIAAVFPICAAYRLARFNVDSTPTSFCGLPSPMAGIIIAVSPIIFQDMKLPYVAVAIVYLIIAFLMTSTITYAKPQATFMQNFNKFKFAAFVILIVALIVIFRRWAIAIILGIYLLSGLINFVIQFVQDHKI